MANEQREFWSTVAQKYDQVVDLQIGPLTRSMVRERVGKEGRLGKPVECAGFSRYLWVRRTPNSPEISPGIPPLGKKGKKALSR